MERTVADEGAKVEVTFGRDVCDVDWDTPRSAFTADLFGEFDVVDCGKDHVVSVEDFGMSLVVGSIDVVGDHLFGVDAITHFVA